eukprot:g19677.t1
MKHATARRIEDEIDSLKDMSTNELVERFVELHGYQTRTRHRTYLIRKIAWRLQANEEGDLSERARKRAAELADDAEVRGRTIRVLVLPYGEGFECDGERFKTLSGVAKHITGSHINGFRFFRLGQDRSTR